MTPAGAGCAGIGCGTGCVWAKELGPDLQGLDLDPDPDLDFDLDLLEHLG